MKRYLLLILLFVFTINSFSQCNEFKKFYYQIPKKKESKVYKFKDFYSEEYYYWKIIADPESQTIRTDFYDANFNNANIFIEKLDNEGSKLIQYTVFDSDNHPIDLEIIENDVFKWCDKKAFKYTINEQLSEDLERVSKVRKVKGIETITIDGKAYETLKLIDTYHYYYKNGKIGKTTSMTFYAPGMGIIENRIYSSDNVIRKMQLKEIITNSDFNKMMNASK